MSLALHAIRNQKILYCVLNWGLGHASRSTPIIHTLLAQDNEVHIASDGAALALLQKEFPQANTYTLPGYNITYNRKSLAIDMTLQLPKLVNAFAREKSVVENLQKQQEYKIIISDHRYGCRSKHTKNIFVAHQIRIMANNQVLSKTATAINKALISSFDTCWIPDEEGSVLSGNLSQTHLSIPTHYIGIQSRFKKEDLVASYDYALVLSGPEPTRTHLEETLISIFQSKNNLQVALVRGRSEKLNQVLPEHITTFDLLPTDELNTIINQCKMVICRSGYSSIMDLHSIGKKAILIPTPGQTEQEYLGQHLADKKLFDIIQQDELQEKLSKIL